MKHYRITRIVNIIAVIISIAIVIALCTYPAVTVKRIISDIVSLANECLNAIRNNDHDEVGEKLNDINGVLETKIEVMKLFYSHEDIAELENAARRAETIYSLVDQEIEVLVSSICDIIESAEHIIERDDLTWGSFI